MARDRFVKILCVWEKKNEIIGSYVSRLKITMGGISDT